jgi:hypothetical protein
MIAEIRKIIVSPVRRTSLKLHPQPIDFFHLWLRNQKLFYGKHK